MRKSILTTFLAVLFSVSAFAQTVNTDSLKNELDKIEVTSPGMKQTIDKYKKAILKGDTQSMNLLGMELMSGKSVKANMEMGLNLLDAAAKQDNVDAQYNLGNYFFIFWLQKKENDGLFSSGIKWLKKAVKGGDDRATIMLARFYYEYGKYKKEISYIDGSIQLLENYPKVTEVNNKDKNVLNAQAWLGTISLGKWRMESDTTALRNAKKWYRILLKSELQFPDYTPYIDSLQAVLSMGVPMRLDPVPTAEQIEESKNSASAGFGGGFPGMGGGGGFPGMGGRGAQQTPQGPRPPQATFLGGNQAMQSFIRANTNYPENLKNQKINGRATVSFTVDKDGAIINPEISNHAIVNDVEIYIMDKEALRTVMIMPDWIPAEDENGTPVQAKHSATVNFGSGGGMGGFGFGF